MAASKPPWRSRMSQSVSAMAWRSMMASCSASLTPRPRQDWNTGWERFRRPSGIWPTAGRAPSARCDDLQVISEAAGFAASGRACLSNSRGFGVTLCRHRFCFKNLVNSLFKSILPDSENRCDLPLVRNVG